MICYSLAPQTSMSSQLGDVPQNYLGWKDLENADALSLLYIPSLRLSQAPQVFGCPLKAENPGAPGISKLPKFPILDFSAAPT